MGVFSLLVPCVLLTMRGVISQSTDGQLGQRVHVQAGKTAVLECRAGEDNTDIVYWISQRYRRPITQDEFLLPQEDERFRGSFEVTVDKIHQIYTLYVHAMSDDVSGFYQCASANDNLNLDVLWSGELVVMPSTTDLSTKPTEEVYLPPPTCFLTYLPPMMNMINMNSEELQLTCKWTHEDHPDGTPTLFCNEKEVISTYLLETIMMSRVTLRDVSECSNFTCELRGTAKGQEYTKTCSSLLDEQYPAAPLPLGIRVDPMYSVVQMESDATFLCNVNTVASLGSFSWDVSSRTSDTQALDRHVSSTNQTSTLTLRNVTVEPGDINPLLVSCAFTRDDDGTSISSVVMLTIVPQFYNPYTVPTDSPDTTTNSFRNFFENFGLNLLYALGAATTLFVFIILFLSISICCLKKRKKSVQNGQSEMNHYGITPSVESVSMRPMNHLSPPSQRVSGDASGVRSSAAKSDSSVSPQTSQQRLHPNNARPVPPWKAELTNRQTVVDDNDYLVPDGEQSVELRVGNRLRRNEGHYSSTDVMVGSRELLSDGHSREDLADSDEGYTMPNLQDEGHMSMDEYVYATSEVTGAPPANIGNMHKFKADQSVRKFTYMN